MIRGVLLRSVLLLELDAAGGATVGIRELCAAVEQHGFGVPGRVSKVVSDALRCERRRGRVVRVGRGRYRRGRLPGTTRRRCHRRVAAARAGAAPPWYLASGRRRGRAAGRRSGDDPSSDAPLRRLIDVWTVCMDANDLVRLPRRDPGPQPSGAEP